MPETIESTDATKPVKPVAIADIPPAPTFQDVPLGGQPHRPSLSYADMVANTAQDHANAALVWDPVIAALEKALADCPPGRSRGAMEIRNHCHVWLVQARSLRETL